MRSHGPTPQPPQRRLASVLIGGTGSFRDEPSEICCSFQASLPRPLDLRAFISASGPRQPPFGHTNGGSHVRHARRFRIVVVIVAAAVAAVFAAVVGVIGFVVVVIVVVVAIVIFTAIS